jgi:hypothetical protein
VHRGSAAGGCNHGDPEPDQIFRECRYSLVLVFCPAVFNLDVAPFHVTQFAQSLAKSFDLVGSAGKTLVVEKSDHRHFRLLRARRQRPRSRPADERYERAPPHSIPRWQGRP